MKRLAPNLQDMLTASFIGRLGFLNKFKRIWGTEVIGGNEYFTGRNYYYIESGGYSYWNRDSAPLAKFLGVAEETRGRQEGVRDAWFFLNPESAKGGKLPTYATGTRELIADNLMQLTGTPLIEGSISIAPAVSKKPDGGGGRRKFDVVPVPFVNDPSVNGMLLMIEEVEEKFESLWNSEHLISTDEDDPYKALLLLVALRSEDLEVKITRVTLQEKGTLVGFDNNRNTHPRVSTLLGSVPYSGLVWTIDLEIKEVEITEDTDVVGLIDSTLRTNSTLTGNGMRRIVEDVEEEFEDKYLPLQKVSAGGFWDRVDGRDLLRTSFIGSDNPMKLQEKIDYLMSLIDTDYRKVKRSFMDYVIAVVIIVVAIVMAIPSGGSSVAGGAAAISGWAVAFSVATIITVAALYVTLAMLAASFLGFDGIAGALGKFMQTVEPLVQIASVITVVGAVRNAAVTGATSAQTAAQEAGGEAARASAMEVARSSMLEIGKVAVEKLLGASSLTDISFAQVVTVITNVVNFQQKQEMKDLQKEIKNYRTQLAELEEAKERSRTSDILKDLQGAYYQLLQQDHSIYAELYDRPYEWWSTKYHTGNMQATTVSALWLEGEQSTIDQ